MLSAPGARSCRRPRARRVAAGGAGAPARPQPRARARPRRAGRERRAGAPRHRCAASPRTLELTDRARKRRDATSLGHVALEPELREAIARQTTGLADEVVGGPRRGDPARRSRRASRAPTGPRRPPGLRRRRDPWGRAGGRRSRDDRALHVRGRRRLVASLVGSLRPEWLVAALLACGWSLVVGTYFVLF